MLEEFYVEHVNPHREQSVAELRGFLKQFSLRFDADADFTAVIRDQDSALVAVGSAKGEVLRNIAVDERVQGAGLTSTILSTLMQDMARRGILHAFIFTRPEKAFLFTSLGFTEIARAEPYAALLESGLGSVASFCTAISNQTKSLPEKRAGLVINGNPFTLGHRALIERAASECAGVIVFVVSEDRSLFPFADRLHLIREGVADLPNVVVVEGGKYIISAATFPTYFTREQDQVHAQTRLDAALFARHIAPCLGIVQRYVGEEPACSVTAAYNAALAELLPLAGIAVHRVPRVMAGSVPISASTVRELIRAGDMRKLETLLPKVTLDYLRSAQNSAIIEAIRTSDSRH